MITLRIFTFTSIILLLILYIIYRIVIGDTFTDFSVNEGLEDKIVNDILAYPYYFKGEESHSKHCNRLLIDSCNLHNMTHRLFPINTMDYFLKMNGVRNNSCLGFRKQLGLDHISVTAIEKDFPIAFSFMVYRDIDRVARLIRILHRPHNFYAIHVDKKSTDDFFNAAMEIQRCFGDNVYVIPRNASIDVIWREYSQVEVELLLAKTLLQMGEWKYLINLTGQEFPLRTNLEIVMALSMLNGSNIVDGILRESRADRIPDITLNFPLTWIKGSVHFALMRNFTEFMLSDTKAIEIADALKGYAYNKFPDETFFQTLANNPQIGAPGACLEINRTINPKIDPERLPLLTRFKKWDNEYCSTKFQRWICMLGSQHLKKLFHAKELFANKFLQDYFPEGYDCLELMIAERAKSQYQFETYIYKNLYCTTAHT